MKYFITIILLVFAVNAMAATNLEYGKPLVFVSTNQPAVMPLSQPIQQVSPAPVFIVAGMLLVAVPAMTNDSQTATLPFVVTGAALIGTGLFMEMVR